MQYEKVRVLIDVDYSWLSERIFRKVWKRTKIEQWSFQTDAGRANEFFLNPGLDDRIELNAFYYVIIMLLLLLCYFLLLKTKNAYLVFKRLISFLI